MAKVPVTIRAPEVGDEVVWKGLWQAYLGFYDQAVPPEATHLTWRRILDAAGPIFGRMAILDGTPVGFLICVVHEGTWSVRPTCYLEDLFVDARMRGGGVGRALLDDLVALGRERHWNSLYWHTRADNAQARKLYDRYVPADNFVRYRLAITPHRQK
ncbi:GNAT family N-acetyltransferase [Lichenicoccus sp.]|uniref:GNAT family N-acetyltransferase n=1 Tax=Lichenicoccus sp. TaxID=2781899 RepID=UPI003D0BF21F